MKILDEVARLRIVLLHTLDQFARAHQRKAAALLTVQFADTLVEQVVHRHLVVGNVGHLGTAAHLVHGIGSLVGHVLTQVGFGQQQIGFSQTEFRAVHRGCGIEKM